jgi:glucose-specific phosphotransferase system IIA component
VTVAVISPCPGRVLPISACVDPVFAEEMVGPGVVIEPTPGQNTVISPIGGRIVKIHPHAFVVLSPEGVGVLVHLGINTVRLKGAGFEVLAEEGATVSAGDPMVRWDPASIPAAVDGQELSPQVPVVVMDRPKGTVSAQEHDVAAGDPLFAVPA